ncbi:bifunctional diaminohydroxyphosphoribosylaminopyrimidine deaminase/5-amino-6-(5-phosphoribosylamino)uracil reductase RibD [Rhodonellum sp.]|uniref:bifunctional diaminohydroxyphosphoribosylaminopyrimidine deaminase/5-amino-6-(5-phosphoribosylamino)uracil reductase RibD n=1 Tax=Rhodonellum sp. TaxID=2231180 RepID=UPI0027237EFB|nr:bifunctional diaminohydroxyphosphoribosylaminopyrimidine deaminase/5-amino-6-(5-phosphoribosylamino)uracil reductase RibD [Rhodonellum sp.]MDO9551679.1 bifunctional diaminohydroxyphosphoribosylaminopyrimidine deaminase/5-amino-6-(5-phosphoribosylamino)uracil reductase RibD [Rhodonellum sp.]
MKIHEIHMRRAMELAEWGLGTVSPNPMVGCVIVHREEIIGEGYHKYYGGPHAEVVAIQSVQNQELLTESTVYVTLEPCAHWGKTPPCAHLLVEKQVKKVVIGAVDTNPLVGGKGIKILKDAGVEVITGVLEEELRFQNRRFFTFIEKQRPYVILKWAQSQDGFVARENFDSKWISNPYSRQMVHRWRAEEDAIMVGTNTAKYDNPKLNVRDWDGKDPLRIVIDKKLELDKSLALFDQGQATICYNFLKNETFDNLEYVKLEDGFQISEILEDLRSRNIQSLIVEGGSYLLGKFIESELWDEARVFTGVASFGGGIPAPAILKHKHLESEIMGDRLRVFYKS